ncbi:hexamerin-like [Coccinella septempunctata]|uniref:hexamerin-like n=1 Tax=Coccinella septempunctata TaxID=41139 RepID=UPI001D06A916|nr:hexamerin-like [Coccinella septempunctata]
MLLLRVLICLSLSALICAEKDNQNEKEYAVADKEFVRKYKLILQLFDHINQPSFHKSIVDTAAKFDLDKFLEGYEKKDVAKKFLVEHNKGHLSRSAIFSEFNKDHILEAKALFSLFYNAKDFEALFEAACWARQNLNGRLFLYSLGAALTHREDCKSFSIPPIYEVTPHFFFNAETIQKAQEYKNKHCSGKTEYPKDADGFVGYTINSSYSGQYLNLHPDQALMNYYLEDVGINAFFYYYYLYYPYWLSGEELGQNDVFYKRGEVFYFHSQESAARFYIERLANNLGDIPEIDWDLPLEAGFNPSMRYPNGVEFPTRPNFADLRQFFTNQVKKQGPSRDYQHSLTLIKDYSRRIRDVIDEGIIHQTKDGKPIKILNEEGLDVLGNMVEGNADSPNRRYFGSILFYARHLLGFSSQSKDKNALAPSALEHSETALRDPAFYQLYKYVCSFFLSYKSSLPPYTKQDLEFPGVSIKKIKFDKLVTRYDYFYSDLSNAVDVTQEDVDQGGFKARVRQYRMNHEPFKYRIYVDSEKDQVASVRVYIGPKYDERGETVDMNDNRINFIQFDYFPFKLKKGQNVIERSSKELFEYCDERTPYRETYQQVLDAESGKEEFKIRPDEVCFPRRVALPKGSVGGTPFQFYVMVSPYKSNEVGASYDDTHQYPVYRMDEYPLGYPLDRPMENDECYKLPNSRLHEALVFFDDKINKNHPF